MSDSSPSSHSSFQSAESSSGTSSPRSLSPDQIQVIEKARALIENFEYVRASQILSAIDASMIPHDIDYDTIRTLADRVTELHRVVSHVQMDESWTLAYSNDTITSHYHRHENGRIVSVKMKGLLPVPALHLLALLHEVDLYHNWFPSGGMVKLLEARLIRKPTAVDAVTYIRTRPPWPFGERDQCNWYRGVDCMDKSHDPALPPHIAILCESLEENPPGWQPGATRQKIHRPSGLLIFPESATCTRVEIFYTVEPQIPFLPDWLLNLIMSRVAPRIMGAIQRATRVVKKRDYQDRINDDGNEYYSHLKKRLPKYCVEEREQEEGSSLLVRRCSDSDLHSIKRNLRKRSNSI